MQTWPDSSRGAMLARLQATSHWDVLVIGGGATGLGVALEAAARGFKVALVEAGDFACGTSSRSTKLVHGGVRYLAQGRIGLVRDALQARAQLLASAPHLAQPLAFVMPSYRLGQRWWMGLGLKIYDALAGTHGLGCTEILSREQTQLRLTGVNTNGLRGGVQYWDAQFDDARYAIAIARTAFTHGAALLNYCRVIALLQDQGRVSGARVLDQETQQTFALHARCVINATGVWVDDIRAMESGLAQRPKMLAPSQGVHLVVDRRFLPGQRALLVPNTADGRVLFAIPWLGAIVLGTTDTPRQDTPTEPAPYPEEIDFILHEAGRYLASAPTRADIRSMWVGLRPLVQTESGVASANATTATSQLSREHTIVVSRAGLLSVTGGKWTTYQHMALDVLGACVQHELLPRSALRARAQSRLWGAPALASASLTEVSRLAMYGDEAALVQALPDADRMLTPEFSVAMVRFAVRYEFARAIEDVLARRYRLLFLDAQLAAQLARPVAEILREELGAGFDVQQAVQRFHLLCLRYQGELNATDN